MEEGDYSPLAPIAKTSTEWSVTAIKFKPFIVAHIAFRLRSTRAGCLQKATILCRGD